MGAFSPANNWNNKLQSQFETEIMQPLLRGLLQEGITFRGLLYPGLIITTEGARVRLMLGDGASRLLRIPPGVAHGVRNLGAAVGRIIYFTDLHFSAEPSSCDEGRLPWDFAGTEVWEVTRG
jgi:hypothetical protein